MFVLNLWYFLCYLRKVYSFVLFFFWQALHWCDEGAYLLASQMVDKFQTKEGAQEALQYLSSHQERAPSVVKNTQDTLSLEFEAVLTPQLQVAVCSAAASVAVTRFHTFVPFAVPDYHGEREAELSSVHDQKQRAVFEEACRCAGSTHTAGGASAWTGSDRTPLQVTSLLPKTRYKPPQLPLQNV